jgi:hypothetical protein
LKAAESALSQIERQFGKGSIMRLGAKEFVPISAISTGSIGVDAALGVGGVPRGRIIEIFGPESSGKTTLSLHVIAEAQRPLVIFPEGVISRHNDRLNHLMEGTALMARGAAKQRAAVNPPGKVVVHPVAIRYFFDGDITAAAPAVLRDIERRLTWHPQDHLPLNERIARIGVALLGLKETEYFGTAQSGTIAERLKRLIDRLLAPLETEWVKGRHEKEIIGRVKLLRTAIVPEMATGTLSEAELQRRWRQLADMYLAQQLSCYPPDYLAADPTPERLLETIERFEEDMTDEARVHRPMRAVVEVGEAIEVSPERARSPDGDPLMIAIREQLEAMLARSLSGGTSTTG